MIDVLGIWKIRFEPLIRKCGEEESLIWEKTKKNAEEQSERTDMG